MPVHRIVSAVPLAVVEDVREWVEGNDVRVVVRSPTTTQANSDMDIALVPKPAVTDENFDGFLENLCAFDAPLHAFTVSRAPYVPVAGVTLEEVDDALSKELRDDQVLDVVEGAAVVCWSGGTTLTDVKNALIAWRHREPPNFHWSEYHVEFETTTAPPSKTWHVPAERVNLRGNTATVAFDVETDAQRFAKAMSGSRFKTVEVPAIHHLVFDGVDLDTDRKQFYHSFDFTRRAIRTLLAQDDTAEAVIVALHGLRWIAHDVVVLTTREQREDAMHQLRRLLLDSYASKVGKLESETSARNTHASVAALNALRELHRDLTAGDAGEDPSQLLGAPLTSQLQSDPDAVASRCVESAFNALRSESVPDARRYAHFLLFAHALPHDNAVMEQAVVEFNSAFLALRGRIMSADLSTVSQLSEDFAGTLSLCLGSEHFSEKSRLAEACHDTCIDLLNQLRETYATDIVAALTTDASVAVRAIEACEVLRQYSDHLECLDHLCRNKLGTHVNCAGPCVLKGTMREALFQDVIPLLQGETSLLASLPFDDPRALAQFYQPVFLLLTKLSDACRISSPSVMASITAATVKHAFEVRHKKILIEKRGLFNAVDDLLSRSTGSELQFAFAALQRKLKPSGSLSPTTVGAPSPDLSGLSGTIHTLIVCVGMAHEVHALHNNDRLIDELTSSVNDLWTSLTTDFDRVMRDARDRELGSKESLMGYVKAALLLELAAAIGPDDITYEHLHECAVSPANQESVRMVRINHDKYVKRRQSRCDRIAQLLREKFSAMDPSCDGNGNFDSHATFYHAACRCLKQLAELELIQANATAFAEKELLPNFQERRLAIEDLVMGKRNALMAMVTTPDVSQPFGEFFARFLNDALAMELSQVLELCTDHALPSPFTAFFAEQHQEAVFKALYDAIKDQTCPVDVLNKIHFDLVKASGRAAQHIEIKTRLDRAQSRARHTMCVIDKEASNEHERFLDALMLDDVSYNTELEDLFCRVVATVNVSNDISSETGLSSVKNAVSSKVSRLRTALRRVFNHDVSRVASVGVLYQQVSVLYRVLKHVNGDPEAEPLPKVFNRHVEACEQHLLQCNADDYARAQFITNVRRLQISASLPDDVRAALDTRFKTQCLKLRDNFATRFNAEFDAAAAGTNKVALVTLDAELREWEPTITALHEVAELRDWFLLAQQRVMDLKANVSLSERFKQLRSDLRLGDVEAVEKLVVDWEAQLRTSVPRPWPSDATTNLKQWWAFQHSTYLPSAKAASKVEFALRKLRRLWCCFSDASRRQSNETHLKEVADCMQDAWKTVTSSLVTDLKEAFAAGGVVDLHELQRIDQVYQDFAEHDDACSHDVARGAKSALERAANALVEEVRSECTKLLSQASSDFDTLALRFEARVNAIREIHARLQAVSLDRVDVEMAATVEGALLKSCCADSCHTPEQRTRLRSLARYCRSADIRRDESLEPLDERLLSLENVLHTRLGHRTLVASHVALGAVLGFAMLLGLRRMTLL